MRWNVFAVRLVLLSAVVLLTSACPSMRGVAVESESGPTYTVEIQNTLAQTVVVSFDDGNGPRLLGSVPASSTERFIVAGPASQSVRIIAEPQGGGSSVTRNVALQVGTVTSVRIAR